MLKLKDIERHLYKELKECLKPYGFEKKKDGLVRDFNTHIDILDIIITYYATAGSWINFSVQISFDSINKMFKEFHLSSRGFATDNYPPLVGTLTKLKGVRKPYCEDVMTLSDVDQVLNDFRIDYEKHIAPFFDKYSNLESIEKYINRNYLVEDDYKLIDKAQMGLLLAYMVQRKDAKQVYEEYVEGWKNVPYDDDLKNANIESLNQLKEFLNIV